MADKRNAKNPGVQRAVPVVIVSPGIIIFPDRTPITDLYDMGTKEANKEYFEVLQKETHMIKVVALPTGIIPVVGVLGAIRDVKMLDNGMISLEFQGLSRVYYHKFQEDRDELDLISPGFASWEPRKEIAITPAEAESEEFLDGLDTLQRLFSALCELLDLHEKLKTKPCFAQVMSELKKLNADNISLAIDGVMNSLNCMPIERSNIVISLVFSSYTLLLEEKVWNRLMFINMALDELLMVVLQEDSDSEAASSDQPDKKEKEEKSESPIFIQEDLARPRQIPERIEPLRFEAAPESSVALDWRTPSESFKNVVAFFDRYIIDQDRAKRELAKTLLRFRLGYTDPRRPTVGGFFLGPTGVGKTEIIKALARYLFGGPEAYTHIDCNALKEQHTGTAVLLGSPPGYIGYDEEPRFTQWNLDKHHFLARLDEKQKRTIQRLDADIRKLEQQLTKNRGKSAADFQDALYEKRGEREKELGRTGYVPGQYVSLVAFDEIERAHPNLYDVLLKILDDGLLQLNNGQVTNFRLSIICFTSNIHGREIVGALTGRGRIGIRPAEHSDKVGAKFKADTWREVVDAAERFFSFNPAFWGRIGKEKMVVFYPLGEEHYLRILEDILLVDELARDLHEKSGIKLLITERAKRHIVDEARDETNRALGARPLRRIFESRVKDPILALLDKGETGGLVRGDTIWVDIKTTEKKPKGEIVIKKESK